MAQVAYIINEPSVMEFMKMLNAPGFQSQRQDFSALIDYISNVEKQYNSILNELNALKEQVSGIKDKKNPIAVMVAKTQETASDIGEKLRNAKDSIIEFTKNALDTIKDKGLTALNAVFGFLRVKDGLQALSDSLGKSVDNAERSIQKIDAMSREYHEMGNSAANIGRIFMNKETSDEVKENGKLARALQLPYIGLQTAFSAMDNTVTKATLKIQSLSDYVANKKPQIIQDSENVTPFETPIQTAEVVNDNTQITALTIFTAIENNLDKLSPAQLQSAYTRLLDMGMNTDLTADENTSLQGLVTKIDTMLPHTIEESHENVLALAQGMEM